MVQRLTEFDTIAAISTPLGEGGISIVRVSGEDAVAIVNRLFKGKDLEKVPSHTINYGHIVDPATGQVIDEVMASVMLAPKTFTKEDIVEINCHGGIVVTNDILQRLQDDTVTGRTTFNVEVQNGVVTVRGVVHNESVKGRALGIARGTQGVVDVIDAIQLR